MAGKTVSVTFPEGESRKLDFVAKRLHLTRQQLIRLAVEQYLQDKDPFIMSGGVNPNERWW